MDNEIAKLLVDAMQEQCIIEAMKAANQERIANGHTIAYGESAFFAAARDLNNISNRMREHITRG